MELLDIPPDIEDAPDAVQARDVKGEIEFDDVGFDYGRGGELSVKESAGEHRQSGIAASMLGPYVHPQARAFLATPGVAALAARARELGLRIDDSLGARGRAALSDVSFRALAGQHVAVVGPTGAGKTTLVNLMLRFYDSTQGSIRLDGVDIRRFKVTSLRQQMSVVLQEPMLFAGTIGENIRYGRPGASDEEVADAAKSANVHDFISSIPEEYDTLIGERGTQLSGGERQRISVVRAFLKDAPILLLDEPTSSIDSRTESIVLAALERLMEGRTTFTVAHRLSTVRQANLILVLDHGRLVGQGNHDSLIADGGLYAQLYDAQLGLGFEDTGQDASGHAAESIPPMVGLFSSLVVVATAALLEDGSAAPLAELFRAVPRQLRQPSWWLLIGAVLAALRDDSTVALRRLAAQRDDASRSLGGVARVASRLLADRETLHSIHESLQPVSSLRNFRALEPDAILSEPWTEVGAAYPDAEKVLAEILPTALLGPPRARAL